MKTDNTQIRIPILLCATPTGRAVIFGYVDRRPIPGEAVTLHDARMVLYWDCACGGIFGLAANGPKGDTRVTSSIVETTATVWREWIRVSDSAVVAFREWEPV